MDDGSVSQAISLTALKSHIMWNWAKFTILLGAALTTVCANKKRLWPSLNVTAVEAISINQISLEKAIWAKMRLKSALQNKIDVKY